MTHEQTDRIADLMVAALTDRIGGEIDIVFRYGSSVGGGSHRWSDLDFSYVPRSADTWESITVMVDEILFDLYPLHWSTLERLAEWEDWRASILDSHQVVYRRDEAAEHRFAGLITRHQALQRPAARAEMVGKALAIFQRAGHDRYQIHRLARTDAAGPEQMILNACRTHARRIVDYISHCLVVANQQQVDTRKLEELDRLPLKPVGLSATLESITAAQTVEQIRDGIGHLMDSTYSVLLDEQQRTHRSSAPFAAVLEAAYPELKADLQRILIACERRDRFGALGKALALYHELTIHLAIAERGVRYSQFNSPADYQADLAARGFPELLDPAANGDFDRLYRQTLRFDERMRETLIEGGAALNDFADEAELTTWLNS